MLYLRVVIFFGFWLMSFEGDEFSGFVRSSS